MGLGQLATRAVLLVVLLAVFGPPAVSAAEALLVPLLMVAAVLGGLRMLWYWTST